MIKINWRASEETIAQFKAKGPQIIKVLYTKVGILMQQLGVAVVERVSNRMVGVRTGRLRASVTVQPVTISGTRISGSVLAGGEPLAPYALFVERGSRAHQVLAVKANLLKFIVDGKVRFAKSVQIPAINPKPFMALTEEENKQRIFTNCKKQSEM